MQKHNSKKKHWMKKLPCELIGGTFNPLAPKATNK